LALQRVATAEAVPAEQRLVLFMEPRFLRGAALTAQGAFWGAVACLREGLASRLGAVMFRPYGFAVLAEALTRQGEHAPSLAAVREGMEEQAETGALRWRSELQRLEGVALIGLNRLDEGQSALDEGQSALDEALRIARRQQAEAYELRAATSLARLGRAGSAR
jgi:hypothetical protein